MPLAKQALPLDAEPGAVANARRWVVEACRQLERDDLIECAELGVSELVTNAVLHGEPPLSVRVRGTREHPRIEVADASRQQPEPPQPALFEEDSEEGFLATFGRGLSIVAMSSVTWGASMDSHGKVVWFEPAPGMHEDAFREGVIDVPSDEPGWAPPADAVPVHLLGVDLKLYLGTQNQYHDLRRELRLLSLAHESDYPLARDLSTMFVTYERQLPQGAELHVDQQLRRGATRMDLTVESTPGAATIFSTMLEMFDLADAFCRAERLLSTARTPAQRDFQSWFLGEFIRQIRGEEPVAWSARSSSAGHRVS
ncbi:ATP-binding protein [uncultured Nocardioides sp.]|uniref:Carboxylesterase, type B n=1 Tax=uncultured Nocardioides sp. TaxID=198441 RepID=A0A6J4MZ00_9ACTN|nr:ATP-binding protein [uncultured Nocardioides sp.]CAA9373029.1 MAG: Carboxylesterase, type B [uncultured Nocardioides sp.]